MMADQGAWFFTPQRRREKKGMCLRTFSISHHHRISECGIRIAELRTARLSSIRNPQSVHAQLSVISRRAAKAQRGLSPSRSSAPRPSAVRAAASTAFVRSTSSLRARASLSVREGSSRAATANTSGSPGAGVGTPNSNFLGPSANLKFTAPHCNSSSSFGARTIPEPFINGGEQGAELRELARGRVALVRDHISPVGQRVCEVLWRQTAQVHLRRERVAPRRVHL